MTTVFSVTGRGENKYVYDEVTALNAEEAIEKVKALFAHLYDFADVSWQVIPSAVY